MTRLNTLSFYIDRDIDVLDEARDSISGYFREMGVRDEFIARIELASYESIINIIDHSDSKYIREKIRVECFIRGKYAVVIISNTGDKFDITKVKLPDISEHYSAGKKRGLGVYFIMTLMDRVDYRYDNNVGKLTLQKRI